MNDAADYTKPFAAKPRPLTLEQAAWITPPAQATDTEGMIDVPRMRAWRRNRLREQIAAHGLDAVVLVEPLAIRYAAGVRNCTLFQMHIQAGYLFVPGRRPCHLLRQPAGSRDRPATRDNRRNSRRSRAALIHVFGLPATGHGAQVVRANG